MSHDSTEYSVYEERSMRAYRTEVPNILFEMKHLSKEDVVLYLAIKRAAGDSGKCFQTARTLADAVRISVGQVANSKRALEAPQSMLDGKSLIRIEETKDRHGRKRHHIKIVDVWPENFAYFAQKYPKVTENDRSPDDRYRSPERNDRSRENRYRSSAHLKEGTPVNKEPVRNKELIEEANSHAPSLRRDADRAHASPVRGTVPKADHRELDPMRGEHREEGDWDLEDEPDPHGMNKSIIEDDGEEITSSEITERKRTRHPDLYEGESDQGWARSVDLSVLGSEPLEDDPEPLPGEREPSERQRLLPEGHPERDGYDPHYWDNLDPETHVAEMMASVQVTSLLPFPKCGPTAPAARELAFEYLCSQRAQVIEYLWAPDNRAEAVFSIFAYKWLCRFYRLDYTDCNERDCKAVLNFSRPQKTLLQTLAYGCWLAGNQRGQKPLHTRAVREATRYLGAFVRGFVSVADELQKFHEIEITAGSEEQDD